MLATEAPKITDWMQAWGSLAGLAMSTAALIFTGLLFRHEIYVRREDQRDKEAAQARLVVIMQRDLSIDDEGVVHEVDWSVTNYSDAPIFQVRAGLPSHWGRRVRLINVIGPGETVEGSHKLRTPILLEELLDYPPTLVARFIDSSGLQWERESTEPPRRAFAQNGRLWFLLWKRVWPLSEPVAWLYRKYRLFLQRTERALERSVAERLGIRRNVIVEAGSQVSEKTTSRQTKA
ncbi:hypothetical protein ABT023_05670 [Micromonospora sp. NPDC002296]|uniref:hypothetical protein n=1 Tax=Micromonospora sp. NPDC002296 TaxID=3154271 RepID=UPI0033318A00